MPSAALHAPGLGPLTTMPSGRNTQRNDPPPPCRGGARLEPMSPENKKYQISRRLSKTTEPSKSAGAHKRPSYLVLVLFLMSIVQLLFGYLLLPSLSSNDNRGEDHHPKSSIGAVLSKQIPGDETLTVSHSKPTPMDPDALDCRAFLLQYRAGNVTDMERPDPWEKSYVTRTTTPKPFYWSLHSPELDKARASSWEKGQFYEKLLTKEISRTFDEKSERNEESIFLDVGGNVGWFSLVAAAHGASKVYMFEPNPVNLVRVCESLSLNDWLRDDRGRDVFVPILKGVSDKVSTQKLYQTDPANPGKHSFSTRHRHNDVVGEFDLVTLDSFAERHGWFDSRPSVGFFKLDVEGYEPRVVAGAQKLFESGIVDLFGMELKRKILESKKHAMMRVLFEAGYELYKHGGYDGPRKVIRTKYENYTALVEDIVRGKYDENLLFRRKGFIKLI